MPGLFAAIEAAKMEDQKSPSPKKPAPPPAEQCIICLEDIDKAPLRCSKCTMCAHPACLAKWFGSETTTSVQAGLPKSSASCPSCRTKLDWDALALQARRKRMPLGMSLAQDNIVGKADIGAGIITDL